MEPDLNRGALAPVADEAEVAYPRVLGEIPRELNGTLLRNGPNPFSGHFDGKGVLSWWPEAAMLHGTTFAEGQATVYRNRWVRTRDWARATGKEDPSRYVASNPNISVISHAGTTMALAEGGRPVAIDNQLQTLGLPSTHPSLVRGMMAHAKIDPSTGEMFGFRQDWVPPFLRYLVFDDTGQEVLNCEIDMESPCMMHDMAITRSSAIFFDLGVSIDLALLEHGLPIPVRWYDDRPCRLGIVPRNGGRATWVEIEPCFIQHVVNAYDDTDGTIVLDVVRYPWYFRFDPRAKRFVPNPLANLWRYRIDVQAGQATAHQLDDSDVELPRINEAKTGGEYRYLYTVEQPSDSEMRGVLKYDLRSGALDRHFVAPGDQNSEPIFVPRAPGADEDDGWILVCVYRRTTDTSDVLILDAKDIAAPPVATVQLPRRIPAGFHGAWVSA